MPSRSVLSRIAAVAALAFAAVAPAAAADLTEAQRLERCANNRSRLTEIERRLDGMMSEEQVARSGRDLDWLTRERVRAGTRRQDGPPYQIDIEAMNEVAGRYGFTYPACVDDFNCIGDLKAKIRAKVEAARAQLPEFRSLTAEAANARTNLSALRCDEASLPEPQKDTGINGTWSSNFGGMRIWGSDGDARGEYEWSGGKLFGTFDGKKFSGAWTQTSSARTCDSEQQGTRYWGRFEFEFDANLTKFEGRYAYCSEDWKPDGWSGSRTN